MGPRAGGKRVYLLLVVAGAAISSGCVATRGPTIRGPDAADCLPRAFVVGVQELAAGGGHTNLYRELATELVESLRATGLFSEVDLVTQLTHPPDVVLSARLSPAGRDAKINPYSYLFWICTLGIVPIVASADTGVYFSRADEPNQVYSFPYPTDVVIGWAALFLNVLPDWSCLGVQHRYAESLRRFLLENRGRLFAPNSS